MLNPRRGVPQWGYDADTQTCTCQRICGSRTLPTFAHTYERNYIYLSVNTTTIGTAPTSCSMFAQMFQRLSCGFYALYPSLACSKFAQVFQRLFFCIVLCFIIIIIARLRFTFRWEGMAASTNCSSNVNCCATLRTYRTEINND